MFLPLAGGGWKAHEVGDRIVYRSGQETISHAIVVGQYRWQVLMARRVQSGLPDLEMDKILYLSEFEVLGFVDHPLIDRPRASDLIVFGTPLKLKFAVVSSISRYETMVSRYVKSKRAFASATSPLDRTSPYSIVGTSLITSDLALFSDFAEGKRIFLGKMQATPPCRPNSAPLPEVQLSPDDPRLFSIEEFGIVVDLPHLQAITIARFQYSTPYLDAFLYHLECVRSGKRYAQGYQTVLTYWGPPDLRVPGSETGEVRAYFFHGVPTDENFLSLSPHTDVLSPASSNLSLR